MIYFIQAASGPIKIGFTSVNVKGRLSNLKGSSHEELTLIAWMDGTKDDEQALHKRFHAERIRKEWFKPSPGLLALCKENAVEIKKVKPEKQYPITPLPLETELREALYRDAERLGRQLTRHIQIIFADHVAEFEKTE